MGRRAYWPVAQQDRGAGRTNHSCLASYWPDCPQEVRFIIWVTSKSRTGLSTGSHKDFVELRCCQTSSKPGPNMYLKGKTPIRKPELSEAKRSLCSYFQLMQRLGGLLVQQTGEHENRCVLWPDDGPGIRVLPHRSWQAPFILSIWRQMQHRWQLWCMMRPSHVGHHIYVLILWCSPYIMSKVA